MPSNAGEVGDRSGGNSEEEVVELPGDDGSSVHSDSSVQIGDVGDEQILIDGIPGDLGPVLYESPVRGQVVDSLRRSERSRKPVDRYGEWVYGDV